MDNNRQGANSVSIVGGCPFFRVSLVWRFHCIH